MNSRALIIRNNSCLSLGLRHLTKLSWRRPSSCFACWIRIGHRYPRTDTIIVLIKVPIMKTRNFMAADPLSFLCQRISSKKKRAALMSSYTFGNKCANILRWSRGRKSASLLYRSIICWTASPNRSASGTNWWNTCRTSINGKLFRGDNAENREIADYWCWERTSQLFISKALFDLTIWLCLLFWDIYWKSIIERSWCYKCVNS